MQLGTLKDTLKPPFILTIGRVIHQLMPASSIEDFFYVCLRVNIAVYVVLIRFAKYDYKLVFIYLSKTLSSINHYHIIDSSLSSFMYSKPLFFHNSRRKWKHYMYDKSVHKWNSKLFFWNCSRREKTRTWQFKENNISLVFFTILKRLFEKNRTFSILLIYMISLNANCCILKTT